MSFESRRAREIAELIRRHEGEPVSAPALREVPLGENRAAREFARRLTRGEVDVVVFLTGVGTRYLTAAIETQLSREALGAALRRVLTVARGPKPVAALWDLFQLRPTILVPEPNTWRDLLATLDAKADVRGKRVAVQEYGESNPELLDGLAARGAEVFRVPIYRWALPEDTQPLRAAIAQILDGKIHVALFTSAQQVVHLFQAAGAEADALRTALKRVVVASVGPIATEALLGHGVMPDVEPEHPKMGSLLEAVAGRARELSQRKRAAA